MQEAPGTRVPSASLFVGAANLAVCAERRIIDRFDSQMSVFTTSARLLDDGVIDPRDTRAVLSKVLSICRDAELREPQKMQFSVARP